MSIDRREDSGEFYPGGTVVPGVPGNAPGVVDDTLTQDSSNPVKSSGIWGAIWGAISAPAASVYEWVVDRLSQKVDKENGKGLSANDYTNEDKDKLDGIEAGSQKNPDLTPYAEKTDVDAVRRSVNEIAQAIANKAEKRELRYDLVEKVGDSVTLDDRACNYMDATTLSDLVITFPPFVTGKVRDFIIILECSADTPTISYESFITLEGEDGVDLTPEEGVNVYFFTEVMPWRFVVARKLVTKLVENIPVTASQLLRAMAERGIDSTAGNFADVMTTLGLTDTDTITNAVNTVMKG